MSEERDAPHDPAGSRGRRGASKKAGGEPPSPHELAGLGITMGVAIAVFAVGGHWLDGRLDTSPLFVLVGVLLGFGSAFYSMYARLVLSVRRQADDEDTE